MEKPTPLDWEAKARVKFALRTQLVEEHAASHREEVTERSAAELDPGTVFSIDDLSQSDDDGQWVGLFEGVVARDTLKIDELDALDISRKDTVEAGAVIAFDGDRYLVGVSGGQFTSDGVAYECISQASPIFAAIDGLQQGDRFTFRDQDHVLELVC